MWLSRVKMFRDLTALLCCVASAHAYFHPTFEKFLADHYGQGKADMLTRADRGGKNGSFGGHEHVIGTKTRHQAIILVHGAGMSAARYKPIADDFIRLGHQNGSIYCTTYGEGREILLPEAGLECDYVKQIRLLIEAVSAFTRRPVDVIGYSMGAPIARKAIMGGRCVDTGEAIGGPLSFIVDTFLSVAGANQGSAFCIFSFPRICNTLNGLNKRSAMLKDLRNRTRYEGEHIFTMYSLDDDKVGYKNQNQIVHTIKDQDGEFEVGGNHDDAQFNTTALQRTLVWKHVPSSYKRIEKAIEEDNFTVETALKSWGGGRRIADVIGGLSEMTTITPEKAPIIADNGLTLDYELPDVRTPVEPSGADSDFAPPVESGTLPPFFDVNSVLSVESGNSS